MNKKYVNKNCLTDAIYVSRDISIKTLQEFTGVNNISFDDEAAYINISENKGVCVGFGDILVKDSNGDFYPVPEDIFNSQFVPVEVPDESNYVKARWNGYNKNSLVMQLGNSVSVVDARGDLSAVLSNGLVVPFGCYVIHNRDNNSWCVVDPDTYRKLFGGN